MCIDDGVLDSNRLYKETLPECLHTLKRKSLIYVAFQREMIYTT